MFIRARPCILLLGDSLTQYGFGDSASVSVGWASHLAAVYARRCDVLNRGFSGYNSKHILDLLPFLFPNENSNILSIPQVAFCTVWLGANDAAPPGEPQHISIDEYAQNIESIVVELRKKVGPKCPILLLTPPPVDEVAWMSYLERNTPDRTTSLARTYGLEVLKIAERHSLCVGIDIWEVLSGESEERKRFLVDGLHLNEDGNKRVFQTILQTIQEQFPEVGPSPEEANGIPLEGALWRELCPP